MVNIKKDTNKPHTLIFSEIKHGKPTELHGLEFPTYQELLKSIPTAMTMTLNQLGVMDPNKIWQVCDLLIKNNQLEMETTMGQKFFFMIRQSEQ